MEVEILMKKFIIKLLNKKFIFNKTLGDSLKYQAMTLAEVLITLGIIGVVAAITLPTLINNYQNTQYVTSLKKGYTEFNEVLKEMSADAGCVNDLQCSGLFDTGTTYTTLGDEFVKHIKIVKNCKTNAGQGCWSANTNYYYDGTSTTNYTFDTDGYYTFITADGMSVGVQNYANNCTQGGTGWTTGELGYMSKVCGVVLFDVNGLKKPNNWGRDVFTFFITNGKGALLYPQSGKDDNYNNTNSWWNYNNLNRCSSSAKNGNYCTGRIIENGWVMDY